MSVIRHIIFDLDGVLVDAKDIHFDAFALACKDNGMTIKRDYHDEHLDGLPTVRKLEKLGITDHKLIRKINDEKQKYSSSIFNDLTFDKELIEVLEYLTKNGFALSVASNATNNTVAIALKRLGIDDFFACSYGNESVKKNKPSPEIYYKCMYTTGLWVPETMVVEDTLIGKEACMAAGLSVLIVESRKDVTLDNILNAANIFKDVFI